MMKNHLYWKKWIFIAKLLWICIFVRETGKPGFWLNLVKFHMCEVHTNCMNAWRRPRNLFLKYGHTKSNLVLRDTTAKQQSLSGLFWTLKWILNEWRNSQSLPQCRTGPSTTTATSSSRAAGEATEAAAAASTTAPTTSRAGSKDNRDQMIKILNLLSNISAHDEKFKTCRISSLSIL